VKGNGEYCSKHKKHEKPEDIKAPVVNKVIPIRLSPVIGKYVHHPTGLVFFSKEERVVYGKLVQNSVVELTADDIELCKTYHFKYDTEKL